MVNPATFKDLNSPKDKEGEVADYLEEVSDLNEKEQSEILNSWKNLGFVVQGRLPIETEEMYFIKKTS